MPDFSRSRSEGGGYDDDFDDDFDDGFENASDDGAGDDPQKVNRDAERPKKRGGDTPDLKAAFSALFQAISGRFTGKEKPARSSGSDSSFANRFDSAVDSGYENEPERPAVFDDRNDPPQMPERDDVTGYFAGEGDFPPEGNPPGDEYGDRETQEERAERTPSAPSGTMGGVLGAVAEAFGKLRRRLPSFRPKVYAPPEPVYTPEDDGIGTPTLASDITRILEEQNKPGETEQEYDRMRSYIRSVSTDTRIRPGDIRPPENLEEVRAAEGELYDLISSISDANERQRGRIGVYEKPPEEDPYNYRGINNDRQFYTDMEAFSFDMHPRYGFESEEKVDPGRRRAEEAYNHRFDPPLAAQSLPEGTADGDGFDDGFDDDFDDGFDDGFDDDFNDDGAPAGDGFSDSFDDDFGNHSGEANGLPPAGTDDGYDDAGWSGGDFPDNAFEDYMNAGFAEPMQRKGGRRYENPDSNAAYSEGFVNYRSKRSEERRKFGRRGAR